MDSEISDIHMNATSEKWPRALFVTTVPVTLLAFLLPFADHFREKGWRVDALARAIDGSEYTTSFGPEQARRLAPHFDNTYSADWTRQASSLLSMRRIADDVRRLVLENEYDIVHVHTPIASFITRYALKSFDWTGEEQGARSSASQHSQNKRPQVIYTAHGFHFYAGQKPIPHEIYKTMERTAAGWVDYLVTINDVDYQAATAFGAIDPTRVRKSAGIGVDIDFYSPLRVHGEQVGQLRTELGVEPDAPMITMVAELSPVKRHHLVLSALRHLLDTNETDPYLSKTKLVLVGEGPLQRQLTDEVRKQGLCDAVIFTGQRRDVADILCVSDLSILASEREGLPRSILESLSCGTPVAGTATRGIADAIGNPDLIAGYNDASGLGDIAASVLGDSSYRERLSEEARERAVSRFSLESVITFYDNLYAEALNEQ